MAGKPKRSNQHQLDAVSKFAVKLGEQFRRYRTHEFIQEALHQFSEAFHELPSDENLTSEALLAVYDLMEDCKQQIQMLDHAIEARQTHAAWSVYNLFWKLVDQRNRCQKLGFHELAVSKL